MSNQDTVGAPLDREVRRRNRSAATLWTSGRSRSPVSRVTAAKGPAKGPRGAVLPEPPLGFPFGQHLRAASMKPKSLQNSVSKRGTVVESFFCQLSSQLGSHFWSLGLSIGARKTISKGSLGL